MLLFKDLLVATHQLMLAVARHFVESDFVLAFVFPYANHGLDDSHGLLVEAFHHLQLVEKHEVAVKATVFLQFLVLEHAD